MKNNVIRDILSGNPPPHFYLKPPISKNLEIPEQKVLPPYIIKWTFIGKLWIKFPLISKDMRIIGGTPLPRLKKVGNIPASSTSFVKEAYL